jgi:hypothetical protein
MQILYDGTDGAAVLALSCIRHVTLQFMAPPLASEADQQEFAAWEQHHWQWGNKPGNFRLMVKQGDSDLSAGWVDCEIVCQHLQLCNSRFTSQRAASDMHCVQQGLAWSAA